MFISCRGCRRSPTPVSAGPWVSTQQGKSEQGWGRTDGGGSRYAGRVQGRDARRCVRREGCPACRHPRAQVGWRHSKALELAPRRSFAHGAGARSSRLGQMGGGQRQRTSGCFNRSVSGRRSPRPRSLGPDRCYRCGCTPVPILARPVLARVPTGTCSVGRASSLLARSRQSDAGAQTRPGSAQRALSSPLQLKSLDGPVAGVSMPEGTQAIQACRYRPNWAGGAGEGDGFRMPTRAGLLCELPGLPAKL